ncbi:MAG TPA: chromosome segregation protein SMC [Clostridiales bacterium]|nr:chromosome segregation protein SMC [Clostridiales bacterium]
MYKNWEFFTLKFKRIELVGFKSFADKTVVNFDDGITAIVGPNGCGKSNVADAIRWVLGEQSSKLLRGSSMQDVIFNGTQSRKSLSYCEVSLVLDNSNRDLDLDYNEIMLTRKLYRSGESEYLINNNTSRLKDIVDILHDAGIGRDGYSIIGQGKVEQIVSSKPENRRGIFEEAAGISKFKDKKVESERKLARTRENIARLKDIMIEIERQLNPLKQQAEKAKTYLALKEELKSLEINNYIYQYDSASSNKQEISLRINAISEEIDNKQHDLDVTIQNYNKNYDDIQKIDKTIKELYDEVVNLTVSLERKSGETTIVKERLNLLKDEANRLNEELSQEQQNIENLELSLKQKNNKIEVNKKNIQVLNESADQISKKYLSVVDRLAKSEDEAEENQQLMISALDKLSDIKADISKLNAEKLASIDRQAELKANQNALNQKANAHKEEVAKLTGTLNSKIAERTNIKTQLDTARQNVETSSSTMSHSADELSELNTTIASLNARKNMLEDMQKNFDGFNGAVKHLLEQSERNAKLKSSFVGVVANLMQVPEKYQTAIEMALGGSIQNVVTENEENAQQIIAYLKQNNFGRATFLPITSLKPRNISGYVSDIKRDAGYLGIASELVSYDKKLSNIFENLLGGTAIVDNLVTAVRIAKQTRYSFKIVTLDGDVINPQGSITGGSKARSAVSILGRDREIEEIKREVEKLSGQKQSIFEKYNLAKQTLETNQKLSEELSVKFNDLNIEIGKSNEVKNQYNILIEQETLELEKIGKDLAELQAKINAIDLSLSKTDELKNSIDGNKQSANKSIEKRQQDFDNLKKERDEYNAKMLDVKVKIAELETEITSLTGDIERINQEIEQRTAKIEQINSNIVANAETIKKAEAVIASTTQDADYVATNNKLTEVKSKLDHLGDYKKELQEELKVLDEDRLTLTTKINKLQDKLFQENLNLTKIDTDIENMQERVWTEYGLNYSTAMPLKRENYDLVEGLKQANNTKREIDKLGYVNVNAIEDSKVYQERFDSYTVQMADLMKAEEDLTKIIKELAEEMTNRFTTSFNTINENFGKVFKELFGGGNARLELVPSESGDVLDAGVDIAVEPPGKKLQSITLLSGGEKALTAIAILFAILKLRPMPFVLLDEIEAALDDANVGRFAKYLQKFSSETQFIVITHRKPTMELADNLYGVTMPEKGVSKVVSVKLSEAIQVDRQSANA